MIFIATGFNIIFTTDPFTTNAVYFLICLIAKSERPKGLESSQFQLLRDVQDVKCGLCRREQKFKKCLGYEAFNEQYAVKATESNLNLPEWVVLVAHCFKLY